MSKKVLILSASPRKGGNSDSLCDQFLLGAQDAGNQTEKLFLRDKRINYCLACDACLRDNGRCIHKDDMAEILDKMIAADVIVMATPIYFFTLSSQIKTLIDRTYPKYTQIKNKEFYFIATVADERSVATEKAFESFRGFTECLEGAVEKGVISVSGVWQKGDIEGNKALEQAYEMGRTV